MRLTASAYPWNAARVGVARWLGEVAEYGFEGVDLAATYHPIDAFSPDGGARLYTSPRGAVHFGARAARYGRIRPEVSSPEVCAAWEAVADRAPALGLAVNAWTITMYQPWIVDHYPDTARVLPSGESVGSCVCPANEDVRVYLASLCDDLFDQFDVDAIKLEGTAIQPFDYGWLRPRVLVAIPPLARELLALCFCPSCHRRGTDAGLDVERLRGEIDEVVAREIAHGGDSTSTERARELTTDPELHEFVVQHERAALDLARIATSKIDGSRRPRVSTSAWTPFFSNVGAASDDLLEEFLGTVDQVTAYPDRFEERCGRVADVAARISRPIQLALTVSLVTLGPSGTPVAAEPEARVVDRVAAALETARAFEVGELNLYGYGLLRQQDIADFVAAVRVGTAVRSAAP